MQTPLIEPPALAVPMPRKWLTSSEAAAYIQVCEKTLYRNVGTGKLKAARVGRDLRFLVGWLDEWLLSTVDH